MTPERLLHLKEYILHWGTHLDRYLGQYVDPSGKRILVVGSGWGSEMYWCLARGAQQVVGIDPGLRSTEPLEAAISENLDAGLVARFAMHQGLVESYVSDEPFDLIVSNNAFEHIFQLNGMMAALRRLMKPGSRVAMFADPLYWSSTGAHIPNLQPWQHLWDNQETIRLNAPANEYHDYRSQLNGMTLIDFLGYLREAGMLCLKLEIVADRHLHRLPEYRDRMPPGIKPLDYGIEGVSALLTFPELL